MTLEIDSEMELTPNLSLGLAYPRGPDLLSSLTHFLGLFYFSDTNYHHHAVHAVRLLWMASEHTHELIRIF